MKLTLSGVEILFTHLFQFEKGFVTVKQKVERNVSMDIGKKNQKVLALT